MKTAISIAALLVAAMTSAFAAPPPPPPPPAPKADLILITYVALYQGNAPISSSGGLTMITLGTYKNFDDCSQAQGKLKIGYSGKGSSNAGFAPGNSLNWGAMCVEKNP